MGAESADDLKKLLREVGYSVKAADEILKWYEPTGITGKRA